MDTTIVYVVVVLVAIVGAIIRNQRGAQGHETAAPPSPWAGMGEWGSEQEEVPMPEPVSHPATKPEPPAPSLSGEAVYTEGKAVARETYAEGGRMNTSRTPVAPPPATATQLDENDLLDHFDLREAVIYSEILKAKFEE